MQSVNLRMLASRVHRSPYRLSTGGFTCLLSPSTLICCVRAGFLCPGRASCLDQGPDSPGQVSGGFGAQPQPWYGLFGAQPQPWYGVFGAQPQPWYGGFGAQPQPWCGPCIFARLLDAAQVARQQGVHCMGAASTSSRVTKIRRPYGAEVHPSPMPNPTLRRPYGAEVHPSPMPNPALRRPYGAEVHPSPMPNPTLRRAYGAEVHPSPMPNPACTASHGHIPSTITLPSSLYSCETQHYQ